MYCANCGNKIIDTASFCPYCGTPVEKPGQTAQAPNQFNAGQTTQAPNQFNAGQNAQAQNQFHAVQAAQAQNQFNYQSAPAQQQIPNAAYQSGPVPGPVPYPAAAGPAVPAGRKRKKTGVIIAVSAVVAAILIGIVIFAAATLLGGRSAREVLDQYINSAYTDAEKYVDTFHPQVVKKLMEIYGYGESELPQFIQDAQEILDEDGRVFKETYGDDWKISYEVDNVSTSSEDDLQGAQKMYGDLGLDVSATKIVHCQLHLAGEKSEETQEATFALVKIGKSWYVHPDLAGANLGLPWDYIE